MRGAGAARRGLGQAPRAMSAERQAVGALLFPPIGGSLRAGRRRSLRTEVVCVGAPGPLARERIAVRCGRFGRFSSVRRLERQTLSLADGLFLKARGGGQTAKFAWARAREGVREGTRGDVARAKRNERTLRLRPLFFRVSRGHWAWGRRVAVWVVRGPKFISPIVKFAPSDGAKAGGALKWVCGETERQR